LSYFARFDFLRFSYLSEMFLLFFFNCLLFSSYEYFRNSESDSFERAYRLLFSIERLAYQGRLEREVLQSITRIIELGAQERGKLGFSHRGSTSVLPSYRPVKAQPSILTPRRSFNEDLYKNSFMFLNR